MIDRDSKLFLAFRINSVLGDKGKASFVEDIDGQHLEIKALNGATFEILAGAEGRDALAGLGLRETKLFGEPADLSEVDADSRCAFELGFIDGLNVLSRATAAEAEAILDGALLAIENAYRFSPANPRRRPPSRARFRRGHCPRSPTSRPPSPGWSRRAPPVFPRSSTYSAKASATARNKLIYWIGRLVADGRLANPVRSGRKQP